ncbi:hypothetical protein Dimus_008705 [Dionaea muscipula]
MPSSKLGNCRAQVLPFSMNTLTTTMKAELMDGRAQPHAEHGRRSSMMAAKLGVPPSSCHEQPRPSLSSANLLPRNEKLKTGHERGCRACMDAMAEQQDGRAWRPRLRSCTWSSSCSRPSMGRRLSRHLTPHISSTASVSYL